MSFCLRTYILTICLIYRYSRLASVLDTLQSANPHATPPELRRLALREWLGMSPEERSHVRVALDRADAMAAAGRLAALGVSLMITHLLLFSSLASLRRWRVSNATPLHPPFFLEADVQEHYL